MKIAISTISKNEEHNVEAFIESCKDADLISVLDTGSSDKTVELLQKHDAFAGQVMISPFRFDEARNKALDRIPEDYDVVISIDLDERLQDGWREELEKIWNDDCETISYWYIGDYSNGQPNGTWRSKIFRRKGYKWFYPVHEMPLPEDGRQPKMINTDKIVVHHLQKGKRDYEELLNNLIKEDPEQMNPYVQRAHEHMKKQNWMLAINDLEKYIELSRRDSEKCQFKNCPKCLYEAGCRALNYIDIANCKMHLGFSPREVLPILIKSTAECPQMREPWIFLAEMWYNLENYPQAYACATTGLAIKDNGMWCKTGLCWAEYPEQIQKDSYNKIIQKDSYNKIK